MANNQTYDARVYSLCAPWSGKRGDAYLRVFKPNFLNGLMGISDEYDTLYSHAMGTDPGAPGVAHAGAAGEIRKSTAAYRSRSAKLQSLAYKHVEDASIKAAIMSECSQLAQAIAAGAALPFGAVAGVTPGRHALAILDRYELCSAHTHCCLSLRSTFVSHGRMISSRATGLYA